MVVKGTFWGRNVAGQSAKRRRLGAVVSRGNRQNVAGLQKTADSRRNSMPMADLRRRSAKKYRPATVWGVTCDELGADRQRGEG